MDFKTVIRRRSTTQLPKVSLVVAIYLLAVPVLCQGSVSVTCAGLEEGDETVPKFAYNYSIAYKFRTETETELFEAGNPNKSRISYEGLFAVSGLSECFFDLTVSDLKTTSSYDDVAAGEPLMENQPGSSIRFRLENGTIQGLWAAKNETLWSLNLKRALVSMLQSSNSQDSGRYFVTSTTVDDINGECPSEYKRDGDIIYRRSDLSRCKRREFGTSVANGVPYSSTSKGFQAFPLLNSNLKCKQEFSGRILRSSQCTEENSLIPLMKYGIDPGPTVKSTTRTTFYLTNISQFDAETWKTSTSRNFVPTSINFEHLGTERETLNPPPQPQIDWILKTVCSDIVSEEISKQAPANFLKLTAVLKTLGSADIRKTYDSLSDICEDARGKFKKIFTKSLIRAEDAAGPVEFLTDQIVNNVLSDEFSRVFLQRLKSVARPSKGVLKSSGRLLKLVIAAQTSDYTDTDFDIVLTTSAVAHQFCQTTDLKCSSEVEYVKVVDDLAAFVQKSLKNAAPGVKSKKVWFPLVVGLQALGNLDHLTSKAVDVILLALSGNQNGRLKIHALQAFRRDSCKAPLKAKAKLLLGSSVFGSDVRLSAYLALMRCFKPEDVKGVQRIVDQEKSNQVFSYIHSHLTNLAESQAQWKQHLKQNAAKVYLDRDLPSQLTSFGKFSKHLEFSKFYNNMNIGGSVDGSIIYSQDSYIPRLIEFNVTADFLGRSYNFVEVGIYAESFENILSRINAPLLMSDEDISPKSNSGPKDPVIHSVFEDLKTRTKIGGRYGDNGQIDVYFRKHGTTIRVICAEQEDLLSFDQLLSLTSETLPERGETLLESLKSLIVDKAEPLDFLEQEIIVPTSGGMPLYLTLDFSAILSSKYEFNLDIKNLLGGPQQDKQMSIKLMPNIAALVRARMSTGPQDQFDAGFQLEGTLHWTSFAEFFLEKHPGEVEILYKFPTRRFRVFEVDTAVSWVRRNAAEELVIPVVSSDSFEKMSSCSNDKTGSYLGFLSPQRLGLKYCYTVQYPQSMSFDNFWLIGPTSYKITSEKLDPNMQGYAVNISAGVGEDGEMKFGISYDTPGSLESRKISIHTELMVAAFPNVHLSFNVEHPGPDSPINFELSPASEEVTYGIQVNYTKGADQNAIYKALLDIQESADGGNYQIVYQPLLSKYSSATGETIKIINGTLDRNVGHSLEVDLSMRPSKSFSIPVFKGLVSASYGRPGEFEWILKNGTISVASPILGRDPFDIVLNSKLHRLYSNIHAVDDVEDLGFSFDTIVGPLKSDLSFSTRLRYSPFQVYEFNAATKSAASPKVDFDFKLLALHTVGPMDEDTRVELSTSLEKQWQISAVRITKENFGSLELIADLERIDRKIILHTYRRHVDDELLTKFDFEAHLKWDDDNDPTQKANAKLGFLMTIAEDLSREIVFVNEITLFQNLYNSSFNLKYPADLLESQKDMHANLKFTTPHQTLYSVKVARIVQNVGTNEESEGIINCDKKYMAEVQIADAPYSALLIKKVRSNQTRGGDGIFSYMHVTNEFNVIVAGIKMLGLELRALQSSKSLAASVAPSEYLNSNDYGHTWEYDGYLEVQPLQYTVAAEIRSRAIPYYIEGTGLFFKATGSVGVSQHMLQTGTENGCNLTFTYTPSVDGHQFGHELILGSNSSLRAGQPMMIPNFQLTTKMYFDTRFRHSWEYLKVGTSGGFSSDKLDFIWSKDLSFNKRIMVTNIEFGTSKRLVTFQLTGGIEEESNPVALFVLRSTSPFTPEVDINFNSLLRNPEESTHVRILVKNHLKFNFHQSYETSIYTTQLDTEIYSLPTNATFSNTLQIIPSYVSSTFKYELDMQDTAFRSGKCTIMAEAEEEDVWSFFTIWKERDDKDSQHPYPLFVAEGNISVLPTEISGTWTIEAPLAMHNTSNFSMVLLRSENFVINTGSLNVTTAWTETSFGYTTERVTEDDAGTIRTLMVKTAPSGVVQNYSSNEQVSIEMKGIQTVKRRGIMYDYVLHKNSNLEKQIAMKLMSEILDEGDDGPMRSNQLVLTRTVDIADEITGHKQKLNVSSGVRYKLSTRNSGWNRQSSLCLLDEKPVKVFDTELRTCTLGYSSKFHQHLGTRPEVSETSGHIALVLLDRISLKTAMMLADGHASLNSSFWLDFLDKPGEELKVSLIRDEKLEAARGKKGAVESRSYSLVASHPFVNRDGLVKITITREENSPYIKVESVLDAFQHARQAITAKFAVEGPLISDDDEDWGDSFDNDDTPTTSISGSEPKLIERVHFSVNSERLPINIAVDADNSGLTYSVMNYDKRITRGRFKVPSLTDLKMIHIGGKPILFAQISPLRLTINSFDSNNSLIIDLEYGSLHPVRIYSLKDAGKQAYTVSLPIYNDEKAQVGYNRELNGVIHPVFDVGVAMNGSKLLQLEFNWKGSQIPFAMEDFASFVSAVGGNIKSMSSQATSQGRLILKSYAQEAAAVLLDIQPLLQKLDKEFKEDLEEIRKHPQSSVVYTKLSQFILDVHERSTLAAKRAFYFVRFSLRAVLHLGKVLASTDYGALAMEGVASAIRSVTSFQKAVGEEVQYLLHKLREFHETYSATVPQYSRAVQSFKDILTGVKDIARQTVKFILLEQPTLEAQVKKFVPPEAHEFVETTKSYILEKLDIRNSELRENAISKTGTSVMGVLESGFNAGVRIGTRVLRSKGFMLNPGDESLLIQFPLLTPIRNIQQILSQKNVAEAKQWVSPKNNWVSTWILATGTSQASGLSNMYAKAKQVINNFAGVGPDDAHGLIIGNNLVRTFDGRFVTIPAKCPYLLSADFLTNDSYVYLDAADVDGSRRKTFSSGDDTLTLLPDGSIEYGGNVTTLALGDEESKLLELEYGTDDSTSVSSIGAFSAIRYDSGLEIVELSKKYTGFMLTCLVKYPVCMVQLEEFLYGRSLGVLGTNNRESFDDFSTPNGEIVGEKSYSRSWKLNRGCIEMGEASKNEAVPGLHSKCSYMFNSPTSPLAACFETVDPEDFYDQCNSYNNILGSDVQQNVCTVAAAYWMHCRQRGIRTDEFLGEC